MTKEEIEEYIHSLSKEELQVMVERAEALPEVELFIDILNNIQEPDPVALEVLEENLWDLV